MTKRKNQNPVEAFTRALAKRDPFLTLFGRGKGTKKGEVQTAEDTFKHLAIADAARRRLGVVIQTFFEDAHHAPQTRGAKVLEPIEVAQQMSWTGDNYWLFREALNDLVKSGVLCYQDGGYYLAGREPRAPR